MHRNAARADWSDIVSWARGQGEDLLLASQLRVTPEFLERYQASTGRGVRPDVLARAGLEHRRDLTVNIMNDKDRERALEDDFQHAMARISGDPANSNCPALFNSLIPRALAIIGEFDDGHRATRLARLMAQWSENLEEAAISADVALSIAPTGPTLDVELVSYEKALASGDHRLIHAWGVAMRTAIYYSQTDLALQVGLEDVAEDRLVRAGH